MNIEVTRRHLLGNLLSGAGALMVSVVMPGIAVTAMAEDNAASGGVAATHPPLTPDQLASFVGINADGSVVAYTGKVDMGQGTDIGIMQMVAEELDMPMERVSIVMGDTTLTVNQGGASGSKGIMDGGFALRRASAEARSVLTGLAADKLGVPADRLTMENGVISDKTDPSKKVSFGELIGGRYFDVKLKWNGKFGNDLEIDGNTKPKPFSDYKLVGTDVRRRDVAPKIFGTAQYSTEVRLPGMLHARVIRPDVAGAVPTAVDESSIKDIPGAKVIRQKDFIAVVAPREWDTIRAAQALKVTWSDVKPPFPSQSSLYDVIRAAKPVRRKVDLDQGNVDDVFASAAKVIEANYEYPFQSHACMGPACAVVDVRADGVTIYSGTQKPHYAADGVAIILNVPRDSVRTVWMFGPGSYGRNDAGDAVMEAAVLSKAVGKPVRMQYMRHDATGWDPKGTASTHKVRAALDKDGKVVGWDFSTKAPQHNEVNANEGSPVDTLVGQLAFDMKPKPDMLFFSPEESYGFPAKRKAWEVIEPLFAGVSPLRTSNLRDPLGPNITFPSESMIDEVAMATGVDPVEFRLNNLTDARDIAVVKTAADKAGWQKHTGPRKLTKGDVMVGQGIAFAQLKGARRGATKLAVVAEIEINRKTGVVWPRRMTVAHDCGQIINPNLLRHTIEGCVIHAASRSLWEEVAFDANNVTSVDWGTYPVIGIMQVPETIDIVLIDHPEITSSGAGEATSSAMAAALANAIYDATGVRLRQVPFTPDKVKAAIMA